MNKTKKCKDCQSDIPEQAKKCAHCKTDQRSWMRRHPILTLFGGFFLLVFIIIIASTSGDTSTDIAQEDNSPSDIEVCVQAQMMVESLLKSPSTADHPACMYGSLSKEGDTYTFGSYVDSQNGFGAMMRTNYKVILTYLEDGSMDIESMVVDGEEVYDVN